MKNSIRIIALFLCIPVYSQLPQMGVNTESGQRTQHIDGNLRVRSMSNKNEDASYNKVLVTDVNGNIDYADLSALKNQVQDLIPEDEKLFYTGTDPDPNKVVTSDKFTFSLATDSNGNMNVRVRLAQASSSQTIHYTVFRKYNNYNNELIQYVDSNPRRRYNDLRISDDDLISYTEGTISLSSSTTWSNIYQGLKIGDFLEIYISYPGDPKIYRINIYARRNSFNIVETNNWINNIGNSNDYFLDTISTTNNYTILVEKF